MWLEILLVFLLILILTIGIVFIYYYVWGGTNTDKLSSLVDEINRSSLYAYKFDKSQDNNLKVLDENINLMHQNYNTLQDNVDFALNEIKAIDQMKNYIATDRLKVNDLQVMDYAFSDKPPAEASGSNWLYLYNGGTFTSGLSMDKLQANSMLANDKIVVGGWALQSPSLKNLHIGSNVQVTPGGNLYATAMCTANNCLREDVNGNIVICPKNTPNTCRKI